jgi:orotidine-5'-phosphate decarboxylase
MPSKQTAEDIKSRIVVALDVPDRTSALKLVETLSGHVGMFKVGLELFTSEGPSLVREIIATGERIFLDLKFHDIPNTVEQATAAATRLGASILDVHALGGAEMMRAASRAVAQNAASNRSLQRPQLLGITVLTSMSESDLEQVGVASDMTSAVVRLARLARESGLDGVVASPQEIRIIREQVASERFIIVTPGIRPAWSARADQKRVATPAAAFRDGADYVVIGRAITTAADPRGAALRIIDEIVDNR